MRLLLFILMCTVSFALLRADNERTHGSGGPRLTPGARGALGQNQFGGNQFGGNQFGGRAAGGGAGGGGGGGQQGGQAKEFIKEMKETGKETVKSIQKMAEEDAKKSENNMKNFLDQTKSTAVDEDKITDQLSQVTDSYKALGGDGEKSGGDVVDQYIANIDANAKIQENLLKLEAGVVSKPPINLQAHSSGGNAMDAIQSGGSSSYRSNQSPLGAVLGASSKPAGQGAEEARGIYNPPKVHRSPATY